MVAKHSRPIAGCARVTVLRAALFGWALWSPIHLEAAAAITNVTVVNVTPSSFSVFWQSSAATPGITVYADPGGITNLAGQLGIEPFPLHTGNPDLSAGFERRQGQTSLRQKQRSLGLMFVRVTGCRPGQTYHYRLSSTPSGLPPLIYPATGPLPSVTTEQENTFVVNGQQLIIEVPGVDTEGYVVTLTHPNASHPLAAVVGDGVGTNQVFFNVNDLFALAGGNFTPLGAQDFTATVRGPNQPDSPHQFSLVFGTNFSVAQVTSASFGTEFLALSVGSTVLRAGQSGAVPLNYNSSVGVVNLNLTLAMPPGHLTNLALQGLSPEIDPASATVTPLAGTNLLLHLAARAGQSIFGPRLAAQLAFVAISNRPSAFVPMRLANISAAKADSALVDNLFAQAGRVVVVGNEPLLEANLTGNGTRQMTLYGKPGFSYAIERSTNMTDPNGWQSVRHFPLTTMSVALAGLDEAPDTLFYRAFEFTPDPPVLDALLAPDQTRSLLVYGRPGSQYTVEYATNLSGIVVWRPLLNYSLSNSFRYLALPASTNTIFYRLGRQ